MEAYKFRILCILLSMVFWVAESAIHVIYFGDTNFEIFPSDGNELWMRSLIVVMLFCFGMYVDAVIKKIKLKEKEKLDVYRSMMYASQHILNNFLNQMLIVKMEAEKCEAFDRNVLASYDSISAEATMLIKKLESVSDLSGENIIDSVLPK